MSLPLPVDEYCTVVTSGCGLKLFSLFLSLSLSLSFSLSHYTLYPSVKQFIPNSYSSLGWRFIKPYTVVTCEGVTSSYNQWVSSNVIVFWCAWHNLLFPQVLVTTNINCSPYCPFCMEWWKMPLWTLHYTLYSCDMIGMTCLCTLWNMPLSLSVAWCNQITWKVAG